MIGCGAQIGIETLVSRIPIRSGIYQSGAT